MTGGTIASGIEQRTTMEQDTLRQLRTGMKGGRQGRQTAGQVMARSAMVLPSMLRRQLSDGPSAIPMVPRSRSRIDAALYHD